MSQSRPAVNILTRYDAPLFAPHFEPERDGYDVIENGDPSREWDLLVVFEEMTTAATYKVRGGKTIFVAGEPPEIGNHSRAFLRQFDIVFCAGAQADTEYELSHEQHFNNWHFGYSAGQAGYRYDHRTISAMPPPAKSLALSTVTSNLNYLPMHIRRRALIGKLAGDYAGQIDFFGRPHRYVEYKEDAILPYRFHLCVENCAVPSLWTEKIADALLGYAVPVYAGCPNVEDYFPGATIGIDLDDYAAARRTIDAILTDGEAMYRHHFDALVAARQRLIANFDISSLIADQLRRARAHGICDVTLTPESEFPMARARNLLARARRKVTTMAWRARMGRDG